MKNTRVVVVGLALASMFGFAVIVLAVLVLGPGRYRHDQFRRGQNTVLVRTDRISGEAEYLSERHGWVPLRQATFPGALPSDVSPNDPYAEAFRGLPDAQGAPVGR